MSLKVRLETDLKAALLGGDRFVADVLRGLEGRDSERSKLLEGKRDEGLDDATIEQLIAREVKKRNDSVQQYTDAVSSRACRS